MKIAKKLRRIIDESRDEENRDPLDALTPREVLERWVQCAGGPDDDF
jgi:hypothetical protein